MQFPDAAEVGEMCLLGLNNNKPEDEGLTSNILDCFYPMSTARVSTMSSGSATISRWATAWNHLLGPDDDDCYYYFQQ